ncbi:MAG: hypothetical protein ACOYW3_15565 [Bacteroidota bacterium]
MKTNILRLLAFVAFLVVAAIGASNAQELPNPEFNGYQFQEPNSYDEKPLIMESDLKYPTKASRDTANHTRSSQAHSSKNAKAAATDPRKPASGGKGEDPLNFNFLYYIIQKFKTSDLIDQ